MTYFLEFNQAVRLRNDLDINRCLPHEWLLTGEGTPGETGWFEVTVDGAGLVFSKKNGEGFVDNAAKMNKIVSAIESALQA
ncbi:unnamed protein product [Hymenolepis diminuta]|uniref:DRBM domain-containing protein n=1 Tax=Hymenolepis diminuta TaxID=6216 RepID=A0A0R3SG92_HYMDI|nr:unnamed protein product [Hymenolepis diminuta]